VEEFEVTTPGGIWVTARDWMVGKPGQAHFPHLRYDGDILETIFVTGTGATETAGCPLDVDLRKH
jgi:hypothetical protein